MRTHFILRVLILLFVCKGAWAHDPSAWGGVFRSRDFGGSWLPADAGQYIGGALALSIDPTNPNHLLFATDTRLLRSVNGGRDWQHEAAGVLLGPITAVSFDAVGKGSVASSAAGVYYAVDGGNWSRSDAPAGAIPARKVIPGRSATHYFLAGMKGLYVSSDRGKRFTRLGEGVLPDGIVSDLLMLHGNPAGLWALVAGQIWRSVDNGASWQDASAGLPAGQVQAIGSAPAGRAPLWAAGADRLYISEEEAGRWQPFGDPLPAGNTSIRAMAVSDDRQIVMLATHRGALRSTDGGRHWQQVEGALPVHLESGLMLRDAQDAQTVYTGFALTPYPEIYRRAQEGSNLLSQVDPISLAGGVAFLFLLILGGFGLARKINRG